MAVILPGAADTSGAAFPSKSARVSPRMVPRTPASVGEPCTAAEGPKLSPEIMTIIPGVTGPGSRLAAFTIAAAVNAGGVGFSVTVAEADLVGSATLVAVTVTACVAAMKAGA